MNLIKKFFKHLLVIFILGYPFFHLLHTLHFLNPLEKELADFRIDGIKLHNDHEKAIEKSYL